MFARTAPEVRGDLHRTETWRRRFRISVARVPGYPRTALWPTRIGALLIAAIVVLMNLAGPDLRAAETILKPLTEDRLPLFTLDALTGERTDLAQLRSGVALVHFFATWCEPGRKELTPLRQLGDRMRDKPITVVGVDAGEVESRVQRFFVEQPVSFPILLDRDRAMSKARQVYVLPTTFLLDGNLMPRLVAEGDFDWTRPEVDETVTKLITPKAAAGEVRRAFVPS